jgi:hypothetical protein
LVSLCQTLLLLKSYHVIHNCVTVKFQVERLQRRDMLARREMVELPEFYVGSIIAVTVSTLRILTSSVASWASALPEVAVD